MREAWPGLRGVTFWRGGLAAAEYEDRHVVVVITPALQSLKGQHSYLSTGLGFEGEAGLSKERLDKGGPVLLSTALRASGSGRAASSGLIGS